ncbi:YchJ family protein [Alcanivorax sp. 1008]|uniref:YchJ family protein n=1 Tax=Alcanivorax sp. 1008 TaxID=2816853 RepID=UPI001E0B5485|nr:YchJ family metal-binding protein [Alcanivorax sp. 1008]MCC1496209.1 SEC-C domain-containing protein [Alcanivorax sp. 1008]
MTECLCGSGLPASQCCSLYLAGKPAPTPEALMRSRFVAYAQQRLDYVGDSWHPDTRPASLDPDTDTRWRRLQILASDSQGDQGMVHFCATWQAGEKWGQLEEVSRFVRENGLWLYHSGDVTHHNLSPGRNDPCPCGSGRKLKKCHQDGQS